MIDNYEFIQLVKSFYKHYGDAPYIENILKINFGEDCIQKIKDFYNKNDYQNSFKHLDKLYKELNKERMV